jgi:hypothetical protein
MRQGLGFEKQPGARASGGCARVRSGGVSGGRGLSRNISSRVMPRSPLSDGVGRSYRDAPAAMAHGMVGVRTCGRRCRAARSLRRSACDTVPHGILCGIWAPYSPWRNAVRVELVARAARDAHERASDLRIVRSRLACHLAANRTAKRFRASMIARRARRRTLATRTNIRRNSRLGWWCRRPRTRGTTEQAGPSAQQNSTAPVAHWTGAGAHLLLDLTRAEYRRGGAAVGDHAGLESLGLDDLAGAEIAAAPFQRKPAQR